jgi:molybdopterin/thiamine biosynthesis adenylyltransferase
MFAKPRLKKSHSITRLANGDIAIGELGRNSYVVRGAPDEFLDLLLLLDGSRTLPRILRDLRRRHDVDPHEVEQVIKQLTEAHLLDDGARGSSTLTSVEIERYDRQMLQFSAYEQDDEPGFSYQERLKSQVVCVLGMGGWGTWMSLNLALMGFGTLRLVDADFVEVSNLNRQVLYDDSSIGLAKVAAAQKSLERINPHIDVQICQEFVEPDRDQIERLLDGATIVCLCWANQSHFVKNTTEEVVHEIAMQRKIPIMEIAGDPFDVAVGPLYLNNGAGPCLRCSKPKMQELWWGGDKTVSEFRKINAQASPLRKVNAWQSAPSLSIIAGLATNELVALASGYKELGLLGKRLNLSLHTYATSVDEFSKNPGCAWCGGTDDVAGDVPVPGEDAPALA